MVQNQKVSIISDVYTVWEGKVHKAHSLSKDLISPFVILLVTAQPTWLLFFLPTLPSGSPNSMSGKHILKAILSHLSVISLKSYLIYSKTYIHNSLTYDFLLMPPWSEPTSFLSMLLPSSPIMCLFYILNLKENVPL